MGSSLAARMAGYTPNTMPTTAVIPMPRATDHGWTAAGSGLSSAVSLRVPEMLERIKEEVSLQP